MRAFVRFALFAALLFVAYTALAAPRLAPQAAEVARARERALAAPLPQPARVRSDGAPALYTYRVVKSYPHDRTCFTQGLVYAGGNTLYESAGQYGASDVREVDLRTGAVRRRTAAARDVFGEGLALAGGQLLQLTWRSGKGLRYDAATLQPAGGFTTPLPDGWGLTNGPQPGQLLATDGSAKLYTLDAETMQLRATVTVTDPASGQPVPMLNELELVDGEVFANVWMTDCVARIDPATGRINGWVLFHGLREGLQAEGGAHGADDVLNGIAWDAQRRRLFVTGKYWSRLFHVELRQLEDDDAEAAGRRASCTRRHAFTNM